MYQLEQILIDLLLQFFTAEKLNAVFSDPHVVAIIIGSLVGMSTAALGTFLVLRKMSMTSDAISHTVLLGIVVAFIVMTRFLSMEPDLSSPWLILGAAAAGVMTVMLTELIHRSGLVKADAALGLAFPLLFALAIILISRYADKVHLDTDAVILGEIGVAWADTNSHCLENCADVVITPDDERAEVGRVCVNCQAGEISPRSPEAIFEETCANCGTYSVAEAWRARLISEPPILVFFPKAITVMGLITLINLVFVLLFYKELKLTTFDSALAATLGFRPGALNYALMVLVSLTAVGAFDAVGSILVVAFFIIPPATAYLLTDRLSVMLGLSPVFGAAAAYTGYDFARGDFLGIFEVSDLLETLDKTIGLDGYTTWNTSISAAMVLMLFIIFLAVWILSPRYGLISVLVRRRLQRETFATQTLLGHIYNHQDTIRASNELALATLHEHLNWSRAHLQQIMARVRTLNLVRVEKEDNTVHLTERGIQQIEEFRSRNLVHG
jgi:ABC-type Mn2+/Zn2+ transport system permease subunit